jgi:hypothetical protein
MGSLMHSRAEHGECRCASTAVSVLTYRHLRVRPVISQHYDAHHSSNRGM